MNGCLNKTINKPLRYLGSELNTVTKQNPKASILLAFPDIYEIGMSHFGSRILYDRVNRYSPYSMERVYMPWKDMFLRMKKNNLKLTSMESGKMFSDFDIVGFSLQNEMSYTNLLAMLDIGGVKIRSGQRSGNDPIVIAGGGAVYNPSPLINFIDAFLIGEADSAILDIMEAVAANGSREERISAISRIEGVYVPSVHGKDFKVTKRVLKSLDETGLISKHIVPHMELIHDRVTYEIQRGCVRGCRFCHAGMVYRPLRQRDPASIIDAVEKDLMDTGYREVGFLSLNACDYPPLQDIISFIYNRFQGQGVYVSLPSLRIESIKEDFLKILSSLPKSGFTIAPEAASSRLKKLINKDISMEELVDTAKSVSRLGWDHIKSYFMIGLPTEDEGDIEAIGDTIIKLKESIPGKRLTASISNFVPKPHTPFQWEEQLGSKGFQERLRYLTKMLRGKNISIKWVDPHMSQVEGLLSRGDSKTGDLIELAYKKGEIFSSWNTEFDILKWESAMKELGIKSEDYLSSIDNEAKLPWDNISTGVSSQWLKSERIKAYDLKTTSECVRNSCTNCGVCSSIAVSNDVRETITTLIPSSHDVISNKKDRSKRKVRIRAIFKKTGKFIVLGHIELMNLIEKAMIRAGVPLSVSSGYSPKPQISFSPPLPFGAESYAELMDMYLYDDISLGQLMESVNSQLPRELHISKVFEVDNKKRSINQDIEEMSWEIEIDSTKFDKGIEYYRGKLKEVFIKSTVLKFTRKGREREIKITDYVRDVSLEMLDVNFCLNFKTCFIDGRTVKPMEFAQSIFEADMEEGFFNIVRTGVRIDGIYINSK